MRVSSETQESIVIGYAHWSLQVSQVQQIGRLRRAMKSKQDVSFFFMLDKIVDS